MTKDTPVIKELLINSARARRKAIPAFDGQASLAPGTSDSRWLWLQTPGGLIHGLTGLALVQAAMILAQAWLLATIIDRAIIDDASLNTLGGLLGSLLLVFLVRSGSETVRGFLAAGASARVRSNLRALLFQRVTDAGPPLRGRTGSGALAAGLIEQVDTLDPWYARFQPQTLTVAVLIPAILVTVFIHDWLAGMLLALTAPLIPFFMVLVGMGAESLSRRQQLALTRLGGVFLDRLKGLDTIRRFGAETREIGHVQALIEDFRSRSMSVLKLAFVSTAVLEFFSAVAIAVVALYIGLGLLEFIEFGPAPELSLRTGLFVLLLAPEFFLPLRQLSQFWHDRAGALAAIRHIHEILATPGARPEPEHPETVPAGGACRIEIRRLSLARPGRGAILKHIDLDIQPGQRVLITGPSGSGKSTLLHVLAGFIAPDSGRVAINRTSLHRISQAGLAELRGWMGQQAGLIDGSIADNIRLGCREAEDGAIDRAIELAGIEPLVRQLPEGPDTRISQDGEGLSGGQARRIALARALVRPRSLLLLDEPTASLDPETAAGIWKTLKSITAQREVTILCASHDAAAHAWAHQTFELVEGRLVKADS